MPESTLGEMPEMSGTYQGTGTKADKDHTAEQRLRVISLIMLNSFLTARDVRSLVGKKYWKEDWHPMPL